MSTSAVLCTFWRDICVQCNDLHWIVLELSRGLCNKIQLHIIANFFQGLYVRGHDVTNLASMCKLKTGRLMREVTDSCLQYWGGMGFTNETIISRFYRWIFYSETQANRLQGVTVGMDIWFGIFFTCRDFRLISIGGGADEVMLSIICKYMGTLPKPIKKWRLCNVC